MVFDYIDSLSLASSLLLLLLICFLLSLSNEAGRLIAFAPFLLIIILLLPFLLFLSTNILSGFMSLSNYWMDCSEIWGYGRYGCEVVQKGFKMSGSTAGPWVCPKPLIFCPDYFSLAIERIVLNFLYDKY